MTKLLGIKELQKNTKKVRKEVEKGITFIVMYRSKAIFKISPISADIQFSAALEAENIYTDEFIHDMKEAEENIRNGEIQEHTPEEFLNSLKK